MNFVGHQGGRQLIRDEHGTSKESGGGDRNRESCYFVSLLAY